MNDTYLGHFWCIYLKPQWKSFNFSYFSLSYREVIWFRFLCELQKNIQISDNIFRSSLSGFTRALETVFVQLKHRNFRKGDATIHLNLQIWLNCFRKCHEM